MSAQINSKGTRIPACNLYLLSFSKMSLEKRLSQTMWQLKKGYAYDTPLGKLPIIQVETPVAASQVSVLPAQTLADGATSVIKISRVQVAVVTIAGTWASSDDATVVIWGNSVTFTAAGSDTAAIAVGLWAAIEADNDASALVEVEVSGSTVTLTAIAQGVLTITASETTAGDGTCSVAVTVAAIGQPDVMRAIQIKGNAGTVTGSVVVKGLDWAGRAISDTIATNGSSAVEGVVPFAFITEITLPARGASGNTISIGVCDKIGLKRPISVAGDFVLLEADGTAEAATVNVANGTVKPTTATDGSTQFKLYYETYLI